MKHLLETRTEENYNGELEQVTVHLNMYVNHSSDYGRYSFHCMRETTKGCFVEYIPYADGNFRVTLANGRKSQKKIDKANEVIKSLETELVNLWKNGQYQTMANMVTAQTQKVFNK